MEWWTSWNQLSSFILQDRNGYPHSNKISPKPRTLAYATNTGYFAVWEAERLFDPGTEKRGSHFADYRAYESIVAIDEADVDSVRFVTLSKVSGEIQVYKYYTDRFSAPRIWYEGGRIRDNPFKFSFDNRVGDDVTLAMSGDSIALGHPTFDSSNLGIVGVRKRQGGNGNFHKGTKNNDRLGTAIDMSAASASQIVVGSNNATLTLSDENV